MFKPITDFLPQSNTLTNPALIADLINTFTITLLQSETLEQVQAAVVQMSQIFSGADQQYTDPTGWLTSDQLGVQLTQVYHVNSDQSFPVMLQTVFADFASDIFDVITIADDDEDSILSNINALRDLLIKTLTPDKITN